MKSKQRYAVPALDKGLDILESLAVAQVPQSLTDLSRALKRTPSELFRILDVLERRKYIGRDLISDGYSLTLKLYELAHTRSPVDHLLRAAVLPMRELAESIRESCHLSILHGQFLMVIAQAESPDPVRLSVEVGYRALPLGTASGKLLISMLDEAERSRFLAADPTYKVMSRAQRLRLGTEIANIRRKRFYVAASTRRTGNDLTCIVGNPRIGVLAALGVPLIPGGPNDGKERKLIPMIRKCANQITAVVGLGTHGSA
jgi:DNA-binding IclR family transcriptional regulator